MSEATPKPSTDAQDGVAACAAKLKAMFPALFGAQPKPIKLRIQTDIQERAPGEFSKQQLSAVLRRHTGSTAYLNAVVRSAHRFDLDGQPAGDLSEEHKEVARQELARRRAKNQERAALEEQERRARFELLKAFESTTLTRTNFCALKGIDEAQLDGLLAQARQEAEEWAARPRKPEAGRAGAPRQGQGRREGGRVGERDGRRDGGARGPRREPRGNGPRRHDDRPQARSAADAAATSPTDAAAAAPSAASDTNSADGS